MLLKMIAVADDRDLDEQHMEVRKNKIISDLDKSKE